MKTESARRRTSCLLLLLGIMIGAGLTGCVRRTLTITTAPPQALVYLNDQEVGRSELTTDFLWYGDYDVVIRKEGCQTLHTHLQLDPPWYQVVPLDFIAEVLWPRRVVDSHYAHFELVPWKSPTHEELIERAEETRRAALQIGREFGSEEEEAGEAAEE